YAKRADNVNFTDRFRRERLDAAIPFTPNERMRLEERLGRTEAEYVRLVGHEISGTRVYNRAASTALSHAMSVREFRRVSLGNACEQLLSSNGNEPSESTLEQQPLPEKRKRHW